MPLQRKPVLSRFRTSGVIATVAGCSRRRSPCPPLLQEFFDNVLSTFWPRKKQPVQVTVPHPEPLVAVRLTETMNHMTGYYRLLSNCASTF